MVLDITKPKDYIDIAASLSKELTESTVERDAKTGVPFDRYWRDLQTFTLHDPVDYKLRAIGDWVLNDQLPVITQYS
ncbi:hypothetical protein A6S26_04635 [Nostoc sp. ATCC 43529]|nr:hypothetical protein A6S26_04635 [Nostoc sp. ATCC 43529]